jgi:hypothetical protein
MNRNVSVFKNIPSFLAFCTIGILLFYPPLAFFIFVSDVVRIFIFVMLIFGLIAYNLSGSIPADKIGVILMLCICVFGYLLGALYANPGEGGRSALGYSLILAFAIIVFSLLQSAKNEGFFTYLFHYYHLFFLITPVFAIINFVINIFTPGLNFLTETFSLFAYQYQASPFGLVLYRSILGINVSRSMFFFIEPVFLSFFYLINIFVVGKKMTNVNKHFILLNVIGGVLSASFFFYIGYIVLKVIKLSHVYKIAILVGLVIAFFIFQKGFPSLVDSTSYDDRYLRLQIGFEILKSYGMERILLGSGFLFDHGYGKGVSSGILSSVIEGGLVGILVPLTIAIIFCERNVSLLLLVIFSLLLFEPFKFPFFWVALILAGQISKKAL